MPGLFYGLKNIVRKIPQMKDGNFTTSVVVEKEQARNLVILEERK
jgi:hypothetical protein